MRLGPLRMQRLRLRQTDLLRLWLRLGGGLETLGGLRLKLRLERRLQLRWPPLRSLCVKSSRKRMLCRAGS